MFSKQQNNNNNDNQLSTTLSPSPSTTTTTATRMNKCAQLQIPGQESQKTRITPSSSSSSFLMTSIDNDNQSLAKTTSISTSTTTTSTTTTVSGILINEFKDFFDDNYNNDKLKCYRRIINGYPWIKMKSFSTTDIRNTINNQQQQQQQQQNQLVNNNNFGLLSSSSSSWWCSSPTPFNNNNTNSNNNNNNINNRKYLSDCNLMDYYRFIRMINDDDDDFNDNKHCIKDYITYSCSTLAICGDTIHSSQLPSPQAQSFRQLNSSLIFSDLDLIKSLNRKIINDAIKKRLIEFIHSIGNQSILSETELSEIDEISNDLIIKPIKIFNQNEYNNNTNEFDYSTGVGGGEILINVVNYEQNEMMKFNKKDKENFVLNWLQTVEPTCIMEPN